MLLILEPVIVNLESLSITRKGEFEGSLSLFDMDSLMKSDSADDFKSIENVENIYFQPINSLNAPNLEHLQLGGEILDIIAVEDLERLFQNLTRLRELSLSFKHTPFNGLKQFAILNTITDFCSDNLKSLELIGFIIDQTMFPNARVLFGKLSSLTLAHCMLPDLFSDGLFSECKALQSLAYYSNTSFIKTTENDFPQLKFARFATDDLPYKYEHLPAKLLFLQQYRDLKELTICVAMDETGMILQFIANNMKQLAKIRIESSIMSSSDSCTYLACISLTKMEYIKKLSVSCSGRFNTTWKNADNYHKYLVFLESMELIESIEYLDLNNVYVDNRMISAIGGLQNLRALKLVFHDNDEPDLCLEPLKALSQLSILQIHGSWTILKDELIRLVEKFEKLRSLRLSTNSLSVDETDETYKNIHDIVQNRRQSLMISLKRNVQEITESTESTSFVAIERNVSAISPSDSMNDF